MKRHPKLKLPGLPSLILVIGLVCGPAGKASADAGTAKTLIETYHQSIKAILSGSKDTDKVRESIKQELASMVDFPAFSELALNRYYDSLNKKERSQYIDAFRKLIEATYVKRIKPGGDHELSFRDEPEEREGKVMVLTTVAKGDNEVDIDYLLHKDPTGKWKIYDILIDEVSMARNYRSQFYKIFKENGLGGPKGLLSHMTQQEAKEK